MDTIRATLPDSIFALGITRPTTNRSVSVRNTYQIADAHSISVNLSYATDSRKNQGVVGFVLPERAYSYYGADTSLELRQFSSLSARSIFENNFTYTSSHNETTPNAQGMKINVIDAFNGGGAQNKSDNTARTYDFGNLFTHLGEKLTIKAGSAATYRSSRSVSENNFTGTFTFSSLAAYRAGQPVSFRRSSGNPLLQIDQSEFGFFVQNDYKMTSRLTLMFGARYEFQTNVSDHNNLNPRLGFAYAPGRNMVIRGGAGIFNERLPITLLEPYRRLDGVHQNEVVFNNPAYPDPFQPGVRNVASVRTIDSDLATPYSEVVMGSIERTFKSTMFVSAAYDHSRTIHRYRNRNLNAARDIRSSTPRSCTPGQSPETCLRPDPSRGNVINFESSGSQNADNVRLNFRERFSIFNVVASYVYAVSYADSVASEIGRAHV